MSNLPELYTGWENKPKKPTKEYKQVKTSTEESKEMMVNKNGFLSTTNSWNKPGEHGRNKQQSTLLTSTHLDQKMVIES